jgi:hypothetical protein
MSGLIHVSADNSIECPCELDIQGVNKIAPYNNDTRCFEVFDEIRLTYLTKGYRLIEYHYHTRGKHLIAGKAYKAELHMVFADGVIVGDLCQLNGNLQNPPNIVVVCIPIQKTSATPGFDPSKEQPIVPKSFFHYDTIIAGTRVRMVVGTEPITRVMSELYVVGKLAKKTEPYDGRMILYSHPITGVTPHKKSPSSRRSRLSKP